MDERVTRIIDLMRLRLEALQALSGEITAAQQACVALDLDGLAAHDREKECLCAELRRVDAELVTLAKPRPREGFAAHLTAEGGELVEPGILESIERLRQQSEAARIEVARRNRTYEEFLRGARSNLKVMMNVLFHCLGVYPPWALPVSATASWEREI